MHDDSEVIDVLSSIYSLSPENIEISDISVLKKGMTNRSYIYRYKDSRYILRIPGEGTEKLIDREQEYNSYRAIEKINICDNPVYINKALQILDILFDSAHDDDLVKSIRERLSKQLK